jgi:hydrogenase expression/formation protein HypC
MCLGVPGKVIELYDAGGIKMAKVDFGDVVREACLEVVPEVEIGQYVIIHVGFAISVLDEEEAQKSLDLLQELIEIDS